MIGRIVRVTRKNLGGDGVVTTTFYVGAREPDRAKEIVREAHRYRDEIVEVVGALSERETERLGLQQDEWRLSR